MAENESTQNPKTSPAQTAASAGRTALNIGKAAAKAGSGNYVGAAMDLVRDPNVRRTVIACLLLVSFLFVSVFLLVGAAITGTIEALYTCLVDNWNENWEEHGVSSEGNVLYLYSIGALDTLVDTIGDTVLEIGTTIKNLFVTEDKADNSELSETSPVTNEDYQTMLESLKDTNALVGESGALQRRINMIKNRVSQRGEQIRGEAGAQYAFDTLGLMIGESLALTLTDNILFNGIESVDFSYDNQAFALTNLEALKIMAAYSIQHDVVFSDADMWDLMEYCGWYALDQEILDNDIFGPDSIYNSSTKGSFSMSFGNQIQAGDDLQTLLSGTSYQLPDPEIKAWSGNFAPQWYYDQIAQLQANNELYDKLAAAGDTEALAGMIRYETDSDGNIILDNFAALGSYQTYGLIDKLYTATEATITVSRTEYEEATALNEALAERSEILRQEWEEAFNKEAYEITTGVDNLINVDSENETISYTFLNTINGYTYMLVRCYDGTILEPVTVTADGEPVTFTDLLPGTDYIAFYQGLTDNIYEIEIFTTPNLWTAPTAYKLIFDLDVTYTSRSIEQLLYDLMGLWPGDLEDTEIGLDGVEYAAGHVGNNLLRKSWTDTYTDSEGNSHTITFERSQGYQVESYNDMLQALALLLEYDTTGLTAPDFGYGNSIVDMAEKELAYYTAQSMYGGMRYWDKAKSIIGWNYGADLDWGACFILCCAYDCGFIGEGQCFGNLGTDWPFSCGGLWTALNETGTAECYSSQSDTYCPVPGDLVFFDSTFGVRDFAHVGIVKEVLPDGSLVTIEGNTENRVGQCTYSNYAIGTYCYTNNGKPIYITAYIHPDYPAAYNTAPQYLSVSGSTGAEIKMRPLALENELYLAGLPRFRLSQLATVAESLAEDFPALHTAQLREAIEAGEPDQIVDAWNALCSSEQADAFRNAQLQIFTEHYAQPLASQLLKKTGFNWTCTKLREELFLGIATTTDSETALLELFETISKDIPSDISDDDLLATLMGEDLLIETLTDQKTFLWPADPENIRTAWIQGIQTLLANLQAF